MAKKKKKPVSLHKRWETEKDDPIKVIKKADLPASLRDDKEPKSKR